MGVKGLHSHLHFLEKHYGDIGFVLCGPMGNRRNFRHASVYPRGVLSHAKS